MTFTILSLLYAGIGIATIVPFARHLYRNKSSYDGPGYVALMAWLSSLVWPVTAVIYGTAHILQRDTRQKEVAREQARNLETARAVVAREDARLERLAEDQRKERNKRLRQQLAAFDKEMAEIEGIATIDQPKHPTWQEHIRNLSRRDPYDF